MFTNCGMPCCAKNLRCHHLYMWEEIMAKLISSPFMLSWIESTVNWLKTRNLLRNADPSIPYKIGYKPEIYRTAPQYPHVLNRGYFHIEEFPLYFVRSLSCVLRQNFLPYKLFGSQLLMFFYRTWVPFKSISAAPSITKYFLVSTHWLFYFQFSILIMKGVKSCSGLSGFSLRSHHICREKKNQRDRR